MSDPVWTWTGKPATRESVQAEAPRGWRPLVGGLYDGLLALGWNGELYQVKEKLAMLRFYTGRLTKEQSALINRAMTMSGRTCEVCGSDDAKRVTRNYWMNALCEKHAADPRPAWEQGRELDKA